MCVRSVIAVLGMIWLGSAARAAEPPKALPFPVGWATRAAHPPKLDGKMTPADGWDAATPLGKFTVRAPRQAERAAPTDARILYDDQALYIGMRLDGPGRGRIVARATQRDDDRVRGDDCVHVFLVPPGAPPLRREPQYGRWYFHLIVNALGTQRDAIGYKGKHWWNGKWTTKTSIRDDGWTLEMRIPFATLGMKGSTKKPWGMNVCRNYWTKGGGRLSAWSPVEHWYSYPWRYGRLVFGEGGPSRQDLPRLFVQRELGLVLSDADQGLRRARADLGAVGEQTAGLRPLLQRLAPLSAGLDSLRKQLAGVGPAAAASARDTLGKQVDALLRDVHSVQRAAYILRLSAKAPAGQPLVALGGPAITDERFRPGKPFPAAFQPTDRLSITACRGEYEPATFVLCGTEDRKGVRVRATDLRGPGGTIPASAVDLHIIKYWFQAAEWENAYAGGGDWGRESEETRKAGVFLPELLLKDDGLIVVDHQRKRNFMRTKDGLVDISDRAVEFNVKGKPIVEAPRLINLAPKDADALQPFDVPAGEIKQIFVTVHVPPDAKAGTYQGEIRVTAPGAAALALPLSVEVLPFDLAPAPIDYSVYYRGHLMDKTPRVRVWSHQKTEQQYRAEMTDLFTHGIVNPSVEERRFEKFVRVMRIRESVGMPKGHIYNFGFRIPRDELDADESRIREFRKQIRPFVQWARANGYKSYHIYGIDEKDHLLPKEKRWIEAAHKEGAKVYVSVDENLAFLELAGGDILDLPILSGPVIPRVARQVRNNGHRLGIYAYPQSNWEKPEIYRRNYGVHLWQAGYDVEMTYAYQHSFGHAWNDFDARTHHKDYNFAYPTVDGVIDTLQLEGMREAVDDTRYVATLLKAAKAVRADPARRAAAVEAERWIRSVDTRGDLDALRRQIVARILELTR